MKGFQVGVLIFFGIFVFLAVLIFSGAIKIGGKTTEEVTKADKTIDIWGTIPQKNLAKSISVINSKNPNVIIKYTYKDPRKYQSELLEAFAFGGLPEIFLLSQDLIYLYEDKVVNIPFTYFPEATYDETYVRAANIFKKPGGFLGFPLITDPLVMYYNQDLLETAGYTVPPKYWSDLFSYVPQLTKKNDALEISTSGVALGEFTNVNNAKEIFMALMLQLDNAVVVRGANDIYKTTLNVASNISGKPAVQSLRFYTEFSDPQKDAYSWNKSIKNSLDAFTAGELAIYFGLASEYKNIELKNPNLNFDVATLPQVKEINNTITYADVYALAIPKTSPKAQIALGISAQLANGSDTSSIVAASGYAPMRRDIVATPNLPKHTKVFYNSALTSRSWIDPNNDNTNALFAKMFENISSGLDSPEDAVDRANNELRVLFSK